MAKLVYQTYGDALFQLAVEENKVDELFSETKAMKEIFEENEETQKKKRKKEIINSQNFILNFFNCVIYVI